MKGFSWDLKTPLMLLLLIQTVPFYKLKQPYATSIHEIKPFSMNINGVGG